MKNELIKNICNKFQYDIIDSYNNKRNHALLLGDYHPLFPTEKVLNIDKTGKIKLIKTRYDTHTQSVIKVLSKLSESYKTLLIEGVEKNVPLQKYPEYIKELNGKFKIIKGNDSEDLIGKIFNLYREVIDERGQHSTDLEIEEKINHLQNRREDEFFIPSIANFIKQGNVIQLIGYNHLSSLRKKLKIKDIPFIALKTKSKAPCNLRYILLN